MPDRHLNLTCSCLASDQAERQGAWASCFHFSKFKFRIFTICFYFREPKIAKLLLPQIAPELSQTSPEFLSPISSQSYCFGFFKFLTSLILTIVFRFP